MSISEAPDEPTLDASTIPAETAMPHRPPISIVPLHRTQAEVAVAAPPTAPKLTYQGGPLLTAVEVFTIFWGSAWHKAPQITLADSINSFFDDILTSALLDKMKEYSVSGKTIGHGRHIGTTTLTVGDPGATVTDVAIQQRLQHAIRTNRAVPQPGPNTLYFVYLPPGTTVDAGGASSCQDFCGYHDVIQGGAHNIYYAVMPFPGCSGCVGPLTQLDALTSTSSHELCEAITDPVPGQGWYDSDLDPNGNQYGEIGDICAWKTGKVGKWTVQLEWSNKEQNCV